MPQILAYFRLKLTAKTTQKTPIESPLEVPTLGNNRYTLAISY